MKTFPSGLEKPATAADYIELKIAYDQLMLELAFEVQRREDIQKMHAREMKYVVQACDELKAKLDYLSSIL